MITDGKEYAKKLLSNVHSEQKCAGKYCTIHNPVKSYMNSWPLTWRSDRGMFERICEHGVGHPDPSQIQRWEETGREYESVHGCHLGEDGAPCCAERTEES